MELETPVILGDKKKVFFAGPMGTGKTEISINYALLWSSNLDEKITLIDLDMVKPYFRLRSVKERLENGKLNILVPPGPYGYADFPIITPQVDSQIRNPDSRAVVDVGGGDTGARLIGRYNEILNPEIADFLYVFNGKRILFDGLDQIYEMIRLMEGAGRFKFTGLVHNSNLMTMSSLKTLESNIDMARQIAGYFNIPIRFHCIRQDLFPAASKKIKGPLLPLKLYLTPEWME